MDSMGKARRPAARDLHQGLSDWNKHCWSMPQGHRGVCENGRSMIMNPLWSWVSQDWICWRCLSSFPVVRPPIEESTGDSFILTAPSSKSRKLGPLDITGLSQASIDRYACPYQKQVVSLSIGIGQWFWPTTYRFGILQKSIIDHDTFLGH